jgi:predicted MFS family arabinose efflux permease
MAGAMMLPTSLSLLNAGFRGRDRAIAFAVWGSTIGGTAALGGWLTTSYSWRWAFGINIPLGIAVVAGTLLLVPESRELSSAHGNDLVGRCCRCSASAASSSGSSRAAPTAGGRGRAR